MIDRTNYDTVRDLLPSPVLEWVKKGDLTLILGEMQADVNWEPAFLRASEANTGRYDVTPDGGLIDPTTGERPLHVYGLPFPRIDPSDPHGGVKAVWNSTVVNYKFGRLHNPFALNWIGRQGFERAVRGQVYSMAFDYQRSPIPNPDRTETRDLFEALGPASVEGTAVLTWRYLSDRPDSVWGYSPAIRRVRQLTAANRSDGFLGSDLTQDDGLLWLGKNQSFSWKLAGSQDVLVPAAVTSHVTLVPGRSDAGGQEWRSPPDFPGARLGMDTPGWTGAPWLPSNMIWVRRPVWLLEGFPKDPYYNYGRQVFYVDRATYKMYYKVVYTPAGEYWKTLVQDLAIGTTPDGSQREVVAAFIIAVDDRADHATYTKGDAPDFIVEYNSAAVQPERLTVHGLLRLGK